MAQNTAQIEEFVRLVLSSWPSYQFAIKNQLAGSLTSAKAKKFWRNCNRFMERRYLKRDAWFVEELSAHLLKHKDICPFALSDWMEDILDTEFSLISDDGTLEPTAKLLVELADLTVGRGAHKGAEAAAKLEEHLQRLRTLSAKSCTNSTTPRLDSSSSESEENNGSDEENDWQ